MCECVCVCVCVCVLCVKLLGSMPQNDYCTINDKYFASKYLILAVSTFSLVSASACFCTLCVSVYVCMNVCVCA